MKTIKNIKDGIEKMLQNFSERLEFDGLTIEDMNKMAGGGGKKSPPPEKPKPMTSLTGAMGTTVSADSETLSATDALTKQKSISNKAKGARGLQIPLTATKSTVVASPASTGIQL